MKAGIAMPFGVGKRPPSITSASGSARFTAPWKAPQHRQVALGVRRGLPEVHGEFGSFQSSQSVIGRARQLGVLLPEGSAGPVAGDRRPHE